MIVAVMSDSHGLLERANEAMAICHAASVEQIIFCGDIGSTSLVDVFCEISTHFVLGNCDGSMPNRLGERITEMGGKLHARFGSVEWGGKRIAFLHGDDERRLLSEIDSDQWDLICYGHTHRHELAQYGKTLLLNPGAFDGRFENPGFALIEIPSLQVTRAPLR